MDQQGVPTVFTTWQVIAICSAVVISVVGFGWWLRGQFDAVHTDINKAKNDLDYEIQSMKSWLGSLMLQLRDKMDPNAVADLTQRLQFKAQATGNPISAEEAQKINAYLDMVIGKKDFTAEQASEFKVLVEKYASDEEVKAKVGRDRLDTLLAIAGSTFYRFFLNLKK